MTDNRILDFEKDYGELKSKLEELKKLIQDKDIDLGGELASLEERINAANEQRYLNLTAWQKVQMARQIQRPTSEDFILAIFQDFIELHGDRVFGDDPAIIGGIAKLNDTPVTVIGHQKGKDTTQNIKHNFGMPNPKGYRKVQRLMQQAEKFHRPLICFIDTPGAYPGIEAEEQGQGWAISKSLLEMSTLKVPVISLVIGEGGSGGALALGVADRVLMFSYAVYSVIAPESCASILLKDPQRAAEMADYLKLTADDLLRQGIIDEIIPEPLEGAHLNQEAAFQAARERLTYHLDKLKQIPATELVEERYQRLRRIGVYQE